MNTEFYVPRESKMILARSERDLRCFARCYRKRVNRVVDVQEAPKRFEQHIDDRGRPMTVVVHARTGHVLEVLQ